MKIFSFRTDSRSLLEWRLLDVDIAVTIGFFGRVSIAALVTLGTVEKSTFRAISRW